MDQCDQVLCDIALKILALQGIDGRTGTMSEEIYEKFYRKKNETTTETVETTEPEVEPIVEETHEEKIEEEVFPVHFTESTAEHSLEMAEIQESTNHPVTPIDFSALSFAVLAGVGIYMARKKHELTTKKSLLGFARPRETFYMLASYFRLPFLICFRRI